MKDPCANGHDFKLVGKDIIYGTDGKPARADLKFKCSRCPATDSDSVTL